MEAKFIGNVLVVEDNPVNQMVIKGQLTRMGLLVDVAEDGQKALDIIDDSSDYDIIFMDVQMPIMDGIECTENIRKNDKNTPIVAVTANVTDLDRENCINCGMNGFISKPLSRNVLISELEKWLTDK